MVVGNVQLDNGPQFFNTSMLDRYRPESMSSSSHHRRHSRSRSRHHDAPVRRPRSSSPHNRITNSKKSKRSRSRSRSPERKKDSLNLCPEVPLQENDVLGKRYRVTKLLGSGNFASIFACLDEKYGEMVALKIFQNIPYASQYARLELRMHKYLSKQIGNQNSWVGYYNHYEFHFAHHYWDTICTPIMGPSLADFHQEYLLKKRCPPDVIQKIVFQVCVALAGLHEFHIVHRDIKLGNVVLVDRSGDVERISRRIVVPKNCEVRLIDFGSATFQVRSDSKSSSPPSSIYRCENAPLTTRYRAPEQIIGQPPICANDMWAIGCMVMELHLGYPLFEVFPCQTIEQLHLFEDVIGGRIGLPSWFPTKSVSTYSPPPRGSPLKELIFSHDNDYKEDQPYQDMFHFVRECFVYEPHHRITAVKAIRHQFLRSVLKSPLGQKALEPFVARGINFLQ